MASWFMFFSSRPPTMNSSQSSLVAWTDHAKLTQKGVKRILESGQFSDLEIRCQERVFKVHKVFLSLYTDFFDNYDNLWIQLDCNPVFLEHIINFVYLGEIIVNYDDMEGFLSTCKKFRLTLFEWSKNDPKTQVEEEGGGGDKVDKSKADSQFQERYELNDFKLLCRKCLKCFADEKKLKNHVWACQRDLVFKCHICDKGFKHKAILENHMRVHDGKKPYACTHDGCDRSFAIRSDMYKHVRITHEKIRFKCESCDHPGYTSKHMLNDHIKRLHVKDCTYPCRVCGKSFSGQSFLKVHFTTCHNRKPTAKPRASVKSKRSKRRVKTKSAVESTADEVNEDEQK